MPMVGVEDDPRTALMLSDKRFQARRTERKCSAGACPPLPAPAGDKPPHYRTGYQHVRGMTRGHAHLRRANFPRTVLGLSSTLTSVRPVLNAVKERCRLDERAGVLVWSRITCLEGGALNDRLRVLSPERGETFEGGHNPGVPLGSCPIPQLLDGFLGGAGFPVGSL